MRAFTKLNIRGAGSVSLGFEDAEVAQAMDGDELAVAISENDEGVNAIAQDIHDSETLEQKAVGLEELAEVADGIDSATENEVQLIDLAADLSVSGVADELEVFETPAGETPSVEAFVGRKISTEGMKQMAKDIWDAIVALVKRAWERLLKFWRRITDQVPGVVKRARAMATRADQMRGKSLKDDGKTVKLGAEGRKFIVNNKAPKNVGDVTSALTALDKTCNAALTRMAPIVKKTCDTVSAKLGEFDIEKFTESLSRINSDANRAFRSAVGICGNAVTGDKRFNKDLTVERSEHLPGNVAVFGQYVDSTDGSALGLSQLVRSCGFTLMASNEREVDIGEITISTLTPAEVGSLVDKIEAICASVKEFNTKHLRDLEKAADKAKAAAARITSQVTDDTKPDAIKHLNSACQYNVAVAKWSSSPFTSLTALALAVCNSAIVIGNKSLSQYKS